MKTSLLITLLAGGCLGAASLSAQPDDMPPPPPDPETVVVDLFAFDADDSNSLDQEELLTGLTELRKQHRGQREGRPPRGPRMDGERQRPDGDGPPPAGKPGKRHGPPSPEAMTARMIENFDENGDDALDTAELLKAMTAMHDRRGKGHPRPPLEEDAE